MARFQTTHVSVSQRRVSKDCNVFAPAAMLREMPRVLVFLFLVIAAADAFAKKPESVAVLPLRPKGGTQKALTEVLDDLLLAAVHGKAKGMRVVGKSDIDATLGFEKMKDLAGCDATSCAAELAGALGVDSILYGTVGKLGAKHIVALNWIEHRTSAVLGRSSANLGKDEEAYDTELARSVDALFGAPVASPSLPPKPSLAGYYGYGTNNLGFVEITARADDAFTIAATWMAAPDGREPAYVINAKLDGGKLVGTWTNIAGGAKDAKWAAIVASDLSKLWVSGVEDPPPSQSWNGVEMTRAPATLDLSGLWKYGPGLVQVTQAGDDVTLELTWTPMAKPGPHFRVKAKRTGFRLRGRYEALFETDGAKAGEWNAVIATDAKTFVVVRTDDPRQAHHWNGLTAVR